MAVVYSITARVTPVKMAILGRSVMWCATRVVREVVIRIVGNVSVYAGLVCMVRSVH